MLVVFTFRNEYRATPARRTEAAPAEDDLATDNRVNHTPSNASDYVCNGEDNGSIPAKGESGEGDRTKTGLRTESGHVCGREHADEIEEENGKE